ncbi:Endonuclease/exonuclease/phosphatase, partial [Mycena polygramma]
MRDQKIGILIVTETHMSVAQALEIEESFMKKCLKLFNYDYPENPAAKGVAVVLNREITNIEGVKIHYLIPGKAMLAVVPWHGTRTMTVLGLYAPTESDEEKINFWNTLCDLWLTTDLPVPDAIGGDFNLVPEAIDRLPHRTDPEAVSPPRARTTFARLMGVEDGWRRNNLDTKAYTHVSTHGTLSRIDKILVSPALMKNCRNWEINIVAGGLTDHRMVSVNISAPGSPYIGKGRWAMPEFLLYDKEFMSHAMEEACKLEDSMSEARTESSNAQTRFKSFKGTVLELAIKRAKTAVGASEKKKKVLVDEREALLNGKPTAPAERRGQNEPSAANVRQQSVSQTPNAGEKSQAEVAELLNHITKYAVNISKDVKPRDTLSYLRRTDVTPERGSRRSSEMAEIARDYHNDLQLDGMDIAHELREEARKEALD